MKKLSVVAFALFAAGAALADGGIASRREEAIAARQAAPVAAPAVSRAAVLAELERSRAEVVAELEQARNSGELRLASSNRGSFAHLAPLAEPAAREKLAGQPRNPQ
ncbi:MAG TPA: hypothetical protein VJN44_03360 [Roseateles sp.]|nr:hypothetical protein [Roseateles sp.]